MPKTYDKKAWLEQKELTKEENLKIIQNIVNNFKEDPEKILEFIDFQSRFYNYSTRNTMLIYAQNPGALFVGSFAAIKKITDELAKEHKLPNGELPYYGIKKGAKAIKIFVQLYAGFFNQSIKSCFAADARKKQCFNYPVVRQFRYREIRQACR